MTELFETLYQSAVDRMNEGRLTGKNGAIDLFDNAAANGDVSEHVRALEMRGTCERMAGDLKAAEATFDEVKIAITSTGAVGVVTPALQGRITRDAAMVFIDILDAQLRHPLFYDYVEEARQKLLVSYDVLFKAGEATERAATSGYLGRLALVSGNRREARSMLRKADDELQALDNRTYEANNLRWLLRAETLPMRVKLYKRARQRVLIDAEQVSRKNELRLLLLGNALYTAIKRRYRK